MLFRFALETLRDILWTWMRLLVSPLHQATFCDTCSHACMCQGWIPSTSWVLLTVHLKRGFWKTPARPPTDGAPDGGPSLHPPTPWFQIPRTMWSAPGQSCFLRPEVFPSRPCFPQIEAAPFKAPELLGTGGDEQHERIWAKAWCLCGICGPVLWESWSSQAPSSAPRNTEQMI